MTNHGNQRAVVVTGASTGIGKAIALALDANGFRVFAGVRKKSDGAALSREAANTLTPIILDVTDRSSIARSVETVTASTNGELYGLVNNAGVWGASVADDDLDKTLADYERIVGSNMKGEYLFGRAVIPIMLAQGTGGEIVNIATDHMVTCGTPNDLCPGLPSCPSSQPGGWPRPRLRAGCST
mgnify:CR=1 FL=1